MYIQVEEKKECIVFHKKKENEISLFFCVHWSLAKIQDEKKNEK